MITDTSYETRKNMCGELRSTNPARLHAGAASVIEELAKERDECRHTLSRERERRGAAEARVAELEQAMNAALQQLNEPNGSFGKNIIARSLRAALTGAQSHA